MTAWRSIFRTFLEIADRCAEYTHVDIGRQDGLPMRKHKRASIAAIGSGAMHAHLRIVDLLPSLSRNLSLNLLVGKIR